MRYGIRRTALLCDLNRQKMQLAMPHPLHGSNMTGEFFYVPDSSTQNCYFQAIIVIHLYIHGGYNQVMMLVLCCNNATGQFRSVYVAKRGNAIIFDMFFQSDSIEQIPYQVTHGFGAIEITALVHYRIKLLNELITK